MNHFSISMIKSGTRVLAGVALATGNFVPAGFILILAEVFGVLEEF